MSFSYTPKFYSFPSNIMACLLDVCISHTAETPPKVLGARESERSVAELYFSYHRATLQNAKKKMLNRLAELTSTLSSGLMIGQEIFHEFIESMGENVGAVTALGYVKGRNFCREVW